MKARTFLLPLLAAAAPLSAQVADPVSPAPAAAPAASPAVPPPGSGGGAGKGPGGGTLGGDVPMLNPGNEVLTWDGKNWNVANNRIVAARFEKYLNEPEDASVEMAQYRDLCGLILRYLAPGYATQQNVDNAFKLLPRASNYEMDAHLCDALANGVYTVWVSQRQQQRLLSANSGLQYEVMALEASTRQQATITEGVKSTRQATKPKQNGPGNQPQAQGNSGTEAAADAKQATLEANNWQTRRLAELVARQKANEVKRELSEIQAKVEFQALIVQFFMQRRFQHVVMSTRFYRAIFNDGDTKLNVGDETKELFTKMAGFSPTVATLDALSTSAMQDVRKGVQAFENCLENKEMAGARNRLQEAFFLGEYLPEIRMLPREKKRRVLAFTQKANQLLSACDTKDYTLAEKLVKEIAEVASDYDASPQIAMIEGAKVAVRGKLLQARDAVASGDNPRAQQLLQEAALIWPRSPELTRFTEAAFEQSDVQGKTLAELDRLYKEGNYRQIFDDSARFIAASAMDPARAKKLQEVQGKMMQAEEAIRRAQEFTEHNEFAAAWESVEVAAQAVPQDIRLRELRSDLTLRASDFVRTLADAEEHYGKGQLGSSLALYLKAQKLYPFSKRAKAGIEKVKKEILSED